MAKIVMASDFHLNFSSAFDRLNSNGLSVRLVEILDSIKWAAELGKQHKAQYFIGLGDIFERPEKLPVIPGRAIKQTFKDVATLYKNKAYFLVGNHDQITGDISILELFNDTINIVTSPQVLDLDGARLFLVPYIRESEDFYATLNTLQQQYDTLQNKYLFGHFWDTSTMTVDPDAIDLSKLRPFFNRIFTGHYHVPTKDTTNLLIYVGTLLNKKFSEEGAKGCWILDTDKNSIKFYPNPHSPSFFITEDTALLGRPEIVNENAYYRVYCDAENVMDINRMLIKSKGVEILQKKTDGEASHSVSLTSVDKKNTLSLKDFVLAHCEIFKPEGVNLEEFKKKGEEILTDI